MKKYIALMISTIPLLPFASYGNDISEVCNSKDYVCQELGPNYIVVYPKKNTAYHHTQVKKRNDSYDNSFTTNHGKDLIEINLSNLTWQAFNDQGELLRSGHVSGGKEYCPDIGRECSTITGNFVIHYKGDESCKSSRFPIGRGGAPMPYCMFFHGGYALHGSNYVPDFNASHGCVRMSPEDAQWLNEEFVKVGLTRVNIHN